jgi:alkylation response protein AidB-like acyl-CoA dehydrogenase
LTTAAPAVPGTDASELRSLRDAVRSFAADLSGEAAARAAITLPDGYDRAAWSRAVDELGLTSVLVPEGMQGLGFGVPQLAAIAEELGAALFCGPFLGSVLASACLTALGDSEPGLLAEIADGSALVSLVSPPFVTGGAGWDVQASRTGEPGQIVLTGHAPVVIDADPGTRLLVAAAGPGGWLLALPEADADGLEVRRLESVDLTRRLFSVTFDAVPARLVADGELAADATQAALAHGQVALAADSAGLAAASLDRVVNHLRTREQFGRPLGSFQALKHTCADLLVDLETARTALTGAAAARDKAELSLLAAAAKLKATEAAAHITTECIQLSGGVGFTWEHPAHLYYRRAKSNELLLGTPAEHRRAIYRLLTAGQSAPTDEGAS